MPLYDYRCTDCDREFELLLKSSAIPLCPECGGANMVKLLSLTAPTGQSGAMLAQARSQAAREGHFSHYQPSERPRTKK